MDRTPSDLTRLIDQSASGNPEARETLFSLVYDELKARAHRQRGRWHGNLTMNTTALVHESYLKLLGRDAESFNSRGHFLATATRAMRQVLVDYARKASSGKRGGKAHREEDLDPDELALPPAVAAEVLDLHNALSDLELTYPDLAQVVECRVFAGMTVEETAECLAIGTATVKRRWAMATSWLESHLS